MKPVLRENLLRLHKVFHQDLAEIKAKTDLSNYASTIKERYIKELENRAQLIYEHCPSASLFNTLFSNESLSLIKAFHIDILHTQEKHSLAENYGKIIDQYFYKFETKNPPPPKPLVKKSLLAKFYYPLIFIYEMIKKFLLIP